VLQKGRFGEKSGAALTLPGLPLSDYFFLLLPLTFFVLFDAAAVFFAPPAFFVAIVNGSPFVHYEVKRKRLQHKLIKMFEVVAA
jgi:hypothetical protein